MLRIIIYTAIMVMAIYLGKKGFLKNKLKNKIDKIQLVLLIILLFIMGMGLGKNKDVINSLSSIGFKSIIMALATIAFSVLALYLYNYIYQKLFNKKGKRKK